MDKVIETINLLLVDNNPDDVILVDDILEVLSNQYHLWHAKSLKEAITLLKQTPLDVILLDLTLPDSSGLDTLHTILSQTTSPILVMSVLKNEEIALEALKLGAHDYIIKGEISSALLEHKLQQAIERQRLLQTLIIKESRIHEIIEKNSDGIVVVDAEGVIRFANPAAENLFHRSSGELIGISFGFPVIGTERTEIEIPYVKENITTVELQTVDFEWEGQPALLVSLRDVTERKLAEEQIHLVVESAPNAIMLVSNDGKLRLVNTQAEHYFGYDRNELNGMDIERLIPDRFRHTHKHHRKSFLASPDPRRMGNGRNLKGLRKNGTEFPVEIGLTPLEFHGEQLTMATIIDITERKQVEEERENLINELTTKNAELEHFNYAVSHDLKSPLVTIKGFLGYLEQDAINGNVERIKSDIRRISNAVEKMQELLGDLLELSRVGSFVNLQENIPFENLASEAISLVEGQILERGVVVELQQASPIVYGDKRRLLEVLQNLLDNAVKYIGNQSHPHIQIGFHNKDTASGQHIFFVKDNGIGIAPEYHEKVFGLFNKLDARSEGTGVGLALVKRIIEMHGGRIWVESNPGQGSAFYFTLPTVQ